MKIEARIFLKPTSVLVNTENLHNDMQNENANYVFKCRT